MMNSNAFPQKGQHMLHLITNTKHCKYDITISQSINLIFEQGISNKQLLQGPQRGGTVSIWIIT